MAQETRAQLYAKILANLPDNTTEQITPATDRAVENAEVESCYNILDDNATIVNYTPTTGTDWVDPDPTEVGGALDDLAGRVTTIEGEPNQTAFETPYTPTTSADWNPEGAPTEVRGGLDILAARTGTNKSTSIAYVSNTGVNPGITPEVGNPLKPFTTFGAAIAALPANNWRVISMGGTYTENIAIGAANDFELDLSGTRLNGTITGGADRGRIKLYGGWVFYGGVGAAVNLGTAGTNYPIELQGGLVYYTGTDEAILLNGSSGIQDVAIFAQNGTGVRNGAVPSNNKAYVSNCRIDTSTTGIQAQSMRITDTKVRATGICLQPTSKTIVHDSSFISTSTGNEPAIRGDNPTSLYMQNCYVNCENGYALQIMQDGTGATDITVKSSELIGEDTCVFVGTASSPIASGVDFVFKDCTLYTLDAAGTGTGTFIFEYQNGAAQTGKLRSINNTYNIAEADTVNIISYNRTEITGLQVPVIEI